ncbi:MAG: AAA family ATPase [Ilumatobacteraceae bacterium]
MSGVEIPITRPQVQLVLTRLLWDRQSISVDAIAELLWGDVVLPEHWRGAVRGVLSKVRGAFVAAGIEARIRVAADGRVSVELPDDVVVDVHRARMALDGAEREIEEDRPDRAASLLEGWFERLDQPFLPASDTDWASAAIDEVEGLARRALALRARTDLVLGRNVGTEALLRTWVVAHPLDEVMHHRLIEALVALGRRAEARTALDRLDRILDVELGIGPAEATRALLGEVDALVARGEQRPAAIAVPDPRPPAPVVAPGPLLGRVAETTHLQAAWEAVVEQRRPQMVLLRGTSGIGKTRLALELATAVSAQGHRTMLCQCVPGASMPFEPLASTILHLDGHAPSAESVRASTASLAGEPSESKVARLRLFESVVEILNGHLTEPSVLVLDDLQWIDSDALVLLEHLLTATEVPLLVVATGRELPDVVHEVLARLARRLVVRSSVITALSADELTPLFAALDESERHRAAVALHRHTGGHPFYIAEIVAAARRSGGDIDVEAVPDAVREWIGHRIDALPRHLRARLELAAVIGPGVRAVDLAACSNVLLDVLLDELDELVEFGLLIDGDEPGRFSLPHQIIQDVVYERLGASRRSRLHLAVAEGLVAANPAVNAAVVADHYLAAGPPHTESAIRLLSQAADEAYSQGAWAVAAERRRAVLAVVEAPEARAASLIGLAKALHLQGDQLLADTVLEEAIGVARKHGLSLSLAEAVLARAGRSGRGAGNHDDATQIALLEEALDALEVDAAADPSPADTNERRRRDSLHCRVEIELAVALSLWAPIGRRAALVHDALDRSRRIQPPDRDLRAQIELGANTVRFGPAQVHDRLAAEADVLAIALGDRSLDTTLTALIYRYEDLLSVGRRDEARPHLDAAIALADRFNHPYWGWAAATWSALDAVVVGDLEWAEALATAAAERPHTDSGGVLACLGVNLVNVRLFQGRSGEVLDLLATAADAHPEVPCYRAVLALCAAEADEMRRARAAYESFRRSRFEVIPHDTNRLLTLAVLADVTVAVGDVAAASDLWGLLEPYRHEHAVLNCYGGGGAYWGPVAGPLAGLATLTGLDEEAAVLAEQARRAASAVGSPLVLARLAATSPSAARDAGTAGRSAS